MDAQDKVFLIVVAMYFIGVFVGWSSTINDHTVQYDCRLAEISVDYPIQVKDKCRKLNETHH